MDNIWTRRLDKNLFKNISTFFHPGPIKVRHIGVFAPSDFFYKVLDTCMYACYYGVKRKTQEARQPIRGGAKGEGKMEKKEYWLIYDEGTESKMITETEAEEITESVKYIGRSFSQFEKDEIEKTLLASNVADEDFEDAEVLAVFFRGEWVQFQGM